MSNDAVWKENKDLNEKLEGVLVGNSESGEIGMAIRVSVREIWDAETGVTRSNWVLVMTSSGMSWWEADKCNAQDEDKK